MVDSGKKLEWIEVMRGVAALWVLLHHANQSTQGFAGRNELADLISRHGFLGVDFFFILSGFIIAYSCNRLAGKGQGVRSYALARMTRIYVPYLPIGIGMLVLYALFPSLSQGGRDPGVLTSLTLLPGTMPTALSVAWTLVHEVLFYAIFSLFFFSRVALLAVLALWGGTIIGLHWMGVEFGRYGWGYVFSPVNLCFLLGVAIYYATRRGVPRNLALAAGLLGTCAVVWGAAQLVPPRISIALGFGALLVFASARGGISGPFARPAVFLGAASYAIYLVHNPLEAAAVRLVLKFDPGASPGFVFLAISAMALIAGLAYHVWYERPALALARRTVGAVGHPAGDQGMRSRR